MKENSVTKQPKLVLLSLSYFILRSYILTVAQNDIELSQEIVSKDSLFHRFTTRLKIFLTVIKLCKHKIFFVP